MKFDLSKAGLTPRPGNSGTRCQEIRPSLSWMGLSHFDEIGPACFKGAIGCSEYFLNHCSVTGSESCSLLTFGCLHSV